MLTFKSNLKDVVSSIVGRVKSINDLNAEQRDKMLRTIALDTAAVLRCVSIRMVRIVKIQT
jgi:hypothetical protein